MTQDVAVLIPAYNAADLLPAALGSLDNQTCKPSEVIVIDDGSTDGTAEVAESFGVQVIQQHQAGPAAARNRGIQESKAPLIAFLDADDWFAPTKIERQASKLHELQAGAIASDAWLVEDEQVVRCKNEGRSVSSVLTHERLLKSNPVICSSMMVRRDLLEQGGIFDEDPDLIATEDYDLWLRLSRLEPIAYMAEPLTFYRVVAGSLASNKRFLRGVDRIMQKLEDDMGDQSHCRKLFDRRRASVRLDCAYDLLQQSGGAQDARVLIKEAQRLAFSWKGMKMWCKSLLR